ncbi:CoA ester lyase [Sphingomonas naphthae]|uniref:CoA ester lyase n=1 Tax=Sphingomonas naphthae TaxID=1813468 RepID=A0ABY7TJN5_9SPHN|nr:CoA ester lyase [Sphingomonas naphthae]WCT73415.1 CoA ester lyase [Sphingomonas naphthae]
MIRPRRSALFLPASNARAIEKARGLDSDVVILDLEDAVAPEEKAAARARAVETVKAGGFGHRELVVRVNGLGSPWVEEDLAALRTVAPDAILAPKIGCVAEVKALALRLNPGVPLWAMIESCAAILHIDAIAATRPLAALIVGANDLAKEMRCTPGADRAPLHAALAMTVMAARAHGLVAFDSVSNDLSGGDAFAALCDQGARFGFDGKTLIHPNQIAPCNAAFSPSEDAIAEAEAIVAGFAAPEAAGKGAIRVNGKMVELLHLDEAKQLLALAEAIRR